MKILETLRNKKVKADSKLEAVTKLVGKVREKYGNSDKEIQAVKVNTVNGMVPISLLATNEKVVVATNEIESIIAMTTAVVESNEGAVFDRVFEGYVAVNPILCNINTKSDSSY